MVEIVEKTIQTGSGTEPGNIVYFGHTNLFLI